MILVVSGRPSEFETWRRARYLTPAFARRVANEHGLIGARPEKILFIGSWKSLPDAHKIEDLARKIAAAYGTKLLYGDTGEPGQC